MTSMRCPECGGTLFTNGRFELAELYQGRPVLLRNVPAQRCDQCGYLSMDLKTVECIQRALTEGTARTTIPADVFDLAFVLRA
jgi:YgiT-type zinc finger domain-containing protein